MCARKPKPGTRDPKVRRSHLRAASSALRPKTSSSLIAFCWLLYNIPALNAYHHARALRDTHRASLSQEEERISELETLKGEFATAPFEKERVIRERYKMVKKGERLIQLVPEEKKEDAK